MVTLDNGVVSWKFKPLGSWPFVMITSPSDEQLMIDGTQVVHGTTDIRAKIWDDKGVASATMQVDGGTAVPMQRIGDTQVWSAPFDSTQVSDGDHKVTVDVQGAGGNTSEDTITVSVNQSGSVQLPQRSFGPSGNDIGAYADKGLLGNHTPGGPGGGGPGGGKAAPAGGGPRAKGGPGGAPPAPADPNAAQTGTPAAPSTGASQVPPDGTQTVAPPAATGGPGPRQGPGCRNGPGGAHGSAQVVSVSGDQVTLKYQDGTQLTVQVGSTTRIVEESAGNLADLQPGQTVDVRAQPGTPASSEAGNGAPSVPASSVDIHATGY